MTITSTTQQIVDQTITSRRSIRAYLPTPVARQDIEQILSVASRAPSGTNTQPWKAYVLTGTALQNMTAEIVDAFLNPTTETTYQEEYAYYPTEWTSPYKERRRKVGFDLYGLLGLTKDDREGMRAQHARNYKFFDAPVGVIFSIDRSMGVGSWLDFGCFLQNVMVAARARNLDTCPQAAFNQFHQIIRRHTGMPDQDIMMCGMALGHADPNAIENTLVTERESVQNFATFIG